MAGNSHNSAHEAPPKENLASTEQTPLLSETCSTLSDQDESYTSFPESPVRARSNSVASIHVPATKIGLARGIAVCLSTWLMIFLPATNMSGMALIQGSIAEDLDAHEVAMWFTSSFLVAMSTAGPIMGRLGTIFSPRALVLPVSLLIAIGSGISAVANSFSVFVFGRVIAGVGGGGIMSLVMILVLELTTKENRGLFIGLTNAGLTVGVSFGAIVYGGLLSITGWRLLFWVQTPMSIIAGLCLFFSLPVLVAQADKLKKDAEEPKTLSKLAQIDYIGAVLLVSAIVLFQSSLAGEFQLWLLIGSLAFLVCFLAFEYLIAVDPIIPLQVLSSRGILFSCLSQLVFMSSRWSVLFYAPIFMLAIKGATPAAAGSILIPTNVGFGLGGFLVGWLHVRRNGSFWLPAIVGVLAFGASMYAMGISTTADSPFWVFIVVILVNGLATGATLNYTLAHLLHLTPSKHHYIATSLFGTFRGFGGSFGTSIGGGVFYRILKANLTEGMLLLDGSDSLTPERQRLISRLLGTPNLVHDGSLSPAVQKIAVNSYAEAVAGVWHAAASIAVAIVVIQAATGWRSPSETKIMSEDDLAEAHLRAEENEGVAEA